MRSVIYQLGFDDFPRVRVGIGHADGQKGLIAHVLGAPEGEDREKLNAAMSDKKSLEKALKSPQAQALLKSILKGGGKNG